MLANKILFFASLAILSLAGASYSYNEKYRPQLHYSPPKGWMNDPNGLVYHDGLFHLFYQHHPNSTVFGNLYPAIGLTNIDYCFYRLFQIEVRFIGGMLYLQI